jgi:hypothetical protein
MKRSYVIILLLFCFHLSYAQNDSAVYFKGAIKANRDKQYQNILTNIINKNLSLPLTDSTEENWEDAFWALEVLQYQSPWVTNRLYSSFDSLKTRSTYFQQSLLDLLYANYAGIFKKEITDFLDKAGDTKTFALCAEYLMQDDSSFETRLFITNQLSMFVATKHLSASDSSISTMLQLRLYPPENNGVISLLPQLLSNDFLRGNTVIFSFQRANRNYPGIVIVRDSSGNFVHNEDSSIFYVPQLARSITALPFYLTNGNTPQGIFKMDGMKVSSLEYIGPTPNIQLRMPYETGIRDFLNDSTITDSVWKLDMYKKLLPPGCRNYFPLYETWYAGKIGRTEIIAHGTTVNTNYYTGKSYYPFTPTEGCLCTQEDWSGENGLRKESGQLKLAKAIKRSGRSVGYYVVINIDDQQKPVSIEEILPYLKIK